MLKKVILASGFSTNIDIVSGKLLKWDSYRIKKVKSNLNGKILYIESSIMLYEAAIIVSLQPSGIILKNGNKNYHPFLFFKDFLMPCIAGAVIDKQDVTNIIMDCKSGKIYAGGLDYKNIKRQSKYQKRNVYANVGSSEAIEKAYQLGVKGIGIFRTEFTAVSLLADVLSYKLDSTTSVEDYIKITNEADTIYKIASHPVLAKLLKNKFKEAFTIGILRFESQPILIRSIDIERYENDAMGLRGIRRCLAVGGGILRIIAVAIKEAISETEGANISVIYPLVSNYKQIHDATKILIEEGLNITDKNSRFYVKVGWKIEQPVAAFNSKYWIQAFKENFKVFPSYLGIGTNDLTQFTLSVGRNVEMNGFETKITNYIKSLYDETDVFIIRMLVEISVYAHKYNIQLILQGEMAADVKYSELFQKLRIQPSLSIGNIQKWDTKIFAQANEKKKSLSSIIKKLFNDSEFSGIVFQDIIHDINSINIRK